MPSSQPGEPQGRPTAPSAEVPPPGPHDAGPSSAAIASHHPSATRKRWPWIVAAIAVVGALVAGVPWVLRVMRTVSTDDAYVNGHVTFVAPRVSGQVARVLVDDNNRVHKGETLVELDREPFQVQVDIAHSAVVSAEADLAATRAQVRAQEGKTRSLRFALQRAIEDVDNQVAQLHARVATMHSQEASQTRAQADFDRAGPLVASGAMTREEYDLRNESLKVSKARVEEALQAVYQARVSLGLPGKPNEGDELTSVPEDLDQSFSAVRQAQAALIEGAAQLGVEDSFNKTPRQMVADFYKRDPGGDIDRIYAQLLENAPAIKQSQAKLDVAKQHLADAELNLRYTKVVAEIDGVVTRREVNPGNNVVAGQSLMAIRSLTEIWIDANFKETQLANLRIGQPVDLDVDMYGSHQQFAGRISGFTMGTGSTLALLPAQNATGNFVKVVQRLPVRIEVLDYDPEKLPLFIGLSVTPYVKIKEKPEGPNAGKLLQPFVTEAAEEATSAGSAASKSEGTSP